MVYAQIRIRLRKWDAQNSLGLWDTNRSPNLGLSDSQQHQQQQKKRKEKRTCRMVDFAVPAEHWVKLKKKRKER